MARLTLSKVPDELLENLKASAEARGVSLHEHVLRLLSGGDDRSAPDAHAGAVAHVGAGAHRTPAAFDELHATSAHGREYDL